MAHYALTLIDGADDIAAYHRIRQHVLFGGSKDYNPNGPEEVKNENLSLLLKLDGAPIGTVRLDQKSDQKAIVRLVAIASDEQGVGHGTALMSLVEGLAKSLNIRELMIRALPAASGFYLRLGYTPFTFDTEDHESIQLHKIISQMTAYGATGTTLLGEADLNTLLLLSIFRYLHQLYPIAERIVDVLAEEAVKRLVVYGLVSRRI